MSETQTIALHDDLIWRETDDGVVIIAPEDGKIRVLNGVASTIWQLVCKKLSISSIRDEIVTQYAVSDAQAEKDIYAFLNDLASRGLVTLS